MNWQPKSHTPPPGYQYGPTYRPSLMNILRGMWYIGRGIPRSLSHDALYAVANMPVAPLLRGMEHIPERGPFVIVANHYERPGLWMAWPALFAAQAVRQRTGADLHWVAIEEWESFSIWGIPVPPALTRAVFERVFSIYGIIAMPPPYAPVSTRAAAMREAARKVRAGDVIGLMPEGDVGATPELLPAREGVGTFLELLAAAGASILPLGLFEQDGHLVARFGPTLSLSRERGLSREEADRLLRDRVMAAIRDLLPPALAGRYRSPE